MTRVKHHVHPGEGSSESNDVVPRDEGSRLLTRVKHHVHPDEGSSESNDVVPRDEKSKTYEEPGANRTGRFFRGAVCSPIPAKSYSSVSGSKIFTLNPRRHIKNRSSLFLQCGRPLLWLGSAPCFSRTWPLPDPPAHMLLPTWRRAPGPSHRRLPRILPGLWR